MRRCEEFRECEQVSLINFIPRIKVQPPAKLRCSRRSGEKEKPGQRPVQAAAEDNITHITHELLHAWNC